MTIQQQIKIYLAKSGKSQVAFAKLTKIPRDRMNRIINLQYKPTENDIEKINSFFAEQDKKLLASEGV